MESKKNQTKEQVLIPRSKVIIALVTAGTILGSAGFAVGLGVGYRSNVNSSLSKEMQNFLKYYETFKDNYYLEENERTLIDGLFYGLTSSVNDDFTFYVSSENNQSQGLGTTSVGVGFERSVYYGNCLITHVMRTSPASQAQFIDAEGNKIEGDIGLKDGDIITKVKEANVVSDYYVLKEHHSSDWSNHISGQAGTEVEFVILRNGEEKRCRVKRGTFDSDKVVLMEKNYSSSYKEAVVKVKTFLGDGNSETSPAQELIDLFNKDLLKDNDTIDNLILDLRGNGGGYVNNCSALLSLFVGKKDSYGYYYYPRTDKYETIPNNASIYRYDGYKNFNNNIKKYTLVIDENSASAAESFVLNMRDFDETKDKVVVVGETSYGKGIAQSFFYPYASSNGDFTTSVRYTSSKVVSCKYNSINKRGIVPDVMVDSVYRSIQDEKEYNLYRKEVKDIYTEENKAIVLTRIQYLIGGSYSSLEDAIKAYQKAYKLDGDGAYNEITATSLNDNFYTYYHNHKPTNIYNSFVEGSSDIDSFSSNQRKFVKQQIEALMGTTYKDFQTACTAFKNAHIDVLGEQVDVFSLDTSYLLQGMIYDAKQVYKDKVIEKAKLSYGA